MQATGGKQYGFLPLSGNMNASTATDDGVGPPQHITIEQPVVPRCKDVHLVWAVPSVDDLEDLRLETDVGVIVPGLPQND